MRWLRAVTVVLAGMLLAGASCAPVHSERPLGERPIDFSKGPVAWNGVWCTHEPAGDLQQREPRFCWIVSVADEANGVLSLNRRFFRERSTDVVDLYVRQSPSLVLPGGELQNTGFLLLSEEDTALRGTYLWALAAGYDQNLLLVWTTDDKRDAFADLVATGQLPGRVVEKRPGRSGVWDMSVDQTVLLGDLKEEHLRLIIERRGALFDLVPMILERLPPTERIREDNAASAK